MVLVLAAMRAAKEEAGALTHSTVEVVHIHMEEEIHTHSTTAVALTQMDKLIHIPRQAVGKAHKEEGAETRRMGEEVVHQEGMRGMSTALAAKVHKVEEAAARSSRRWPKA